MHARTGTVGAHRKWRRLAFELGPSLGKAAQPKLWSGVGEKIKLRCRRTVSGGTGGPLHGRLPSAFLLPPSASFSPPFSAPFSTLFHPFPPSFLATFSPLSAGRQWRAQVWPPSWTNGPLVAHHSAPVRLLHARCGPLAPQGSQWAGLGSVGGKWAQKSGSYLQSCFQLFSARKRSTWRAFSGLNVDSRSHFGRALDERRALAEL